jgi:hypothetical protein
MLFTSEKALTVDLILFWESGRLVGRRVLQRRWSEAGGQALVGLSVIPSPRR